MKKRQNNLDVELAELQLSEYRPFSNLIFNHLRDSSQNFQKNNKEYLLKYPIKTILHSLQLNYLNY